MKSRLFVIYLIYGDAHLDSGLSELSILTTRILPNFEKHEIVVDNARVDGMDLKYSNRRWLLSGDNSSREFSGWDVGFRLLLRNYSLGEDDVVILANDTFHRNYGKSYLREFHRGEVNRALKRFALIGYVDSFPARVEAFGLEIQSWIRGSLLISRAATLSRLYPFALPIAEDLVFSDKQGEFFTDHAPLSANYQGYLKSWLFEDSTDPSFQQVWHSKTALNDGNKAHFQGKCRAILLEQMISARAIAQKIEIFNTRAALPHRIRRLLRGIGSW